MRSAHFLVCNVYAAWRYDHEMESQRAILISPMIDHLHPKATDAEKVKLTVEWRAHVAALYRLYCRMDADGLLDADSPEIGDNARI